MHGNSFDSIRQPGMNDHYWSSGNAIMNMVRVVWFFSQTVAPVTEVTVSCCYHIRQRLRKLPVSCCIQYSCWWLITPSNITDEGWLSQKVSVKLDGELIHSALAYNNDILYIVLGITEIQLFKNHSSPRNVLSIR